MSFRLGWRPSRFLVPAMAAGIDASCRREQNLELLDDHVGAAEQRGWYGDTERIGDEQRYYARRPSSASTPCRTRRRTFE
jgi:hypothetical protein